MNKTYRIIFSLLLIIFLVSCAKIQSYVKATPDILSLSSVLIKPEDIQGQWEWKITYDDKSFHVALPDYKTPTPSPNENEAFNAFAGYDAKKYYFTFSHLVKEYGPKKSLPGGQSDKDFPESLLLNLDGIGDHLDYECSQKTNVPIPVFYCRISVEYGNIESILAVSGDPRIGQENIEMIIRQILLTVEDRIKRYQAQ